MSLLAPLYLFGLLGLLLPWLLHRFSHHEPPEQVFPTTQFLEPTKPPATSKRKLRYWPLLALRILFLAALCLLFAQPWLRSINDQANAEVVQLVIVDNSFSMRASDRWTQANSAVNTVLNEIPSTDAVQLLSYSGQLSALTDITNDRGLIKTAMALVEPGYEPADFGELMRRLNKVAGDIEKPVTATFITDAQRSNLPQQMNTLLANRLKSFNVVSVKDEAPVNYYLRAEARTDDAVTARVSVRVAASESAIELDGDARTVSKSVQIILKDRVLGTQDTTLQAGESKTLVFDSINLPSDTDELMQVGFVQSDFLPEDDQVAIPVRGSSAVTISVTNIGGEPEAQATVFISTALETDGDARVELLDASTALSPGVRHAVVFVDSISAIPDAVSRFVMAGGNALLLPSKAGSASGESISADASSITRIDIAHALALGDINWFDTRFFTPQPYNVQSADRVLLGLDSGEALLIERSVGDQGRLLLLNDALGGFNSDLPLQPAFVQLMQQLVDYFDASNAVPAQITVGSDLFLPANTQLLEPDGESMLALSQLSQPNSLSIDKPGVYSVLGATSSQSVTAVLSLKESNLLGLGRDELDAWEARHDANAESSTAVSENDGIGNLADAFDDLQDKQTLWQWLLPTVMLLLLVESLFANRFLWVRRDGL